tara:strand:+ start:2882 stop:4936 length:2055 start_codon:yes stop_codon:yes gene_type:complete
MSFNWQAPLFDLLRKTKSKKEPAYIKKLTEAGIRTIEDLLWIIPLKSRSIVDEIQHCNDGDIYTSSGIIKSIRSFRNFRAKGRNRVPLSNVTAIVESESKLIELKWFNAYPSIEKSLRSKERTLINFYGPIKRTNDRVQIINPKLELNNSDSIIQYPTVNSVPGNRINELLNKIPRDSWHNIYSVLNIPDEPISLSKAFQKVHGIEKDPEPLNEEDALNRIIKEEFYTEQIMIERRKFKREQNRHNFKFETTRDKKNELHTSFNFSLTNDQKKVLDEILDDFNSPYSMTRLIQGDVGCGKTAVALAASRIIIHNHFQVAMMAPTESLAIQLFNNAKNYFKDNLKVEVLLGSFKKSDKNNITQRLETGDIDLIVGTHSLIQEGVHFKRLGLSIIDEQHKFGVNQRIALNKKSITGHTLIMSATPIPRSLSLTKFGDLEISIISEKPNGKSSIPSRIITKNTKDKFLSFLLTRLEMGEQAYVVAPAIEESESIEIENLENIYLKFKALFPNVKTSYIHGKLKSEEKQSIFKDFKNKKIDLLVSTSLIEVGIDVENATTMIVYGPERFGLSSLHQLRGRVGRGSKPGFFFMVIEKEISNESMERLRVIEEHSDGFKIAEQDLLQRGEGDLLGTSQSGEKHRKIADLAKHQELLEESISTIELIKKDNPQYFQSIICSKDLTVEEFTV